MIKLIVLAGLTLAAAIGTAIAGEIIKVDALDKTKLDATLKAAPDDALIEFNGVTKTKAEWRKEIVAKRKPSDPEKRKALAAAAKEKFDAAVRDFNDAQDKAIAEETARVNAEFEKLKAR